MRIGKRIAPAALAVAVVAAAPAAKAEGPYVFGAVGGAFMQDSNLDSGAFDLNADHDAGFAGLAGLGYALPGGFRVEAELGYRDNDVDSVSGVNASGETRAYSAMANLLYDFDVDWPVRPFIGVGAGLARVARDDIAPVGPTSLDDHDTGFAYQFIAGAEYPLSDRLGINLSYRYLRVPDLDYTAASGAGIDSDYASHTVLLGLRFRFGVAEAKAPAPAPAMAAPPPAAAPPAPPAPKVAKTPPPMPSPPPPPRNFIVFFDWDSARLTREASDIVADAARASLSLGSARIVATGHADRSGPARYNLGLSRRRAETVKAELVRLGVPAGTIVVRFKGETEPLVPTADGVREPQNRRVEIVIE